MLKEIVKVLKEIFTLIARNLLGYDEIFDGQVDFETAERTGGLFRTNGLKGCPMTRKFNSRRPIL